MQPDSSSDHVTTRIHPAIYRAIVGLALVLILSIWSFAGTGYSGLAIAVAMLFVAVVLILSYVLSRIARRRAALLQERPPTEGLWRWLSEDFDAFSGRLKGWEALTTLILPLAAVSLGMMVFAIILHFDIGSAA